MKVYGLNVTAMGTFSQLMGMTASAGGSLFADDLATVDFTTPEALQGAEAGTWTTRRPDIGPSVVNPDPERLGRPDVPGRADGDGHATATGSAA